MSRFRIPSGMMLCMIFESDRMSMSTVNSNIAGVDSGKCSVF
eukprot:SAG11_NODE_24253_length_376_cov_0.653430_1_plen_41_part_01